MKTISKELGLEDVDYDAVALAAMMKKIIDANKHKMILDIIQICGLEPTYDNKKLVLSALAVGTTYGGLGGE